MPAAIASRACCRVDLAGGTLDIWPLGLLHDGARTVNLAITLEARAALEKRDRGYRVDLDGEALRFETLDALRRDSRVALIGEVAHHYELPPCTIRTDSDSPRGAGLGGSSALMVALIDAAERFLGATSSPDHRAAVARDLEARLMSLPTGRQDHFPALFGGALEIVYRAGGERVLPLAADLDALGERLVVAYTGQSHFSAGSNWQMIRRRLDGDAASLRSFDGIAATAAELARALEGSDWPRVGALMAREWSFRRELAEGISTPRLERLLAAATAAGAWGGKACGAGGGGSVAILCPPERRPAVEAAVAAEGGRVLETGPSRQRVSAQGPAPRPRARTL